MAGRKYQVLFFINGMVPTEEQRNYAAMTFGPYCAFRNARFVTDDEGLEPCDAVYGDVPARYAAAFPQAVSIADFYAGKLTPVPVQAATGEATDAPDSGAGSADTFDPFAGVGGAVSRRAGPSGLPADWTPQG